MICPYETCRYCGAVMECVSFRRRNRTGGWVTHVRCLCLRCGAIRLDTGWFPPEAPLPKEA